MVSEDQDDPSGQSTGVLCAGDLKLDPRSGAVSLDGAPIQLTQKSIDLLRVLMEHPQDLVTKEALIEAVWGGRAVSEAVLTTAMGDLRKALGDKVKDPVYIKTLHGRGYRFLLPVTRETAEAQPDAITTASPKHAGSAAAAAPGGRKPAWAGIAGMAGILLLVGGLTLFLGFNRGWFGGGHEEALPSTPQDRYTILIATLSGDDPATSFTRNAAEALLAAFEETGAGDAPVWIDRLPRVVAIEGAGLRGDVAEAEDRARNLLEATGAEILIWGEVVQELRTYSLRLTSSVSNRFTRYAFEDLRFGEPLLRDLAPLVLGAALAEAGDVDFARATAPALGPLVDRLAPLAENPPDALSAEQVRDLRIAYAKVATEYGAIAEGQERLARVVEMLDRVLEATSRQDEPRPWASIQKTRAYTLRQWGEMGPTQALRKAVAAEKAALEIYSREDDPMDWARTQLDLGICYSLLNERVEEGSAQAAAEAFSAALEILTREETPLDWADAQLNLGKALYDAGQRGEVGALEASVAAYRRALTVHTRERRPKVWARTMSNLGNALQQLGMRTSDEARLEASVDAYRAALSVLTRDAAPLDWAVIQNNLANTFVALADYGRSDALDEALAAYQAALTVHTRDNAPMDWAIAVGNLAVIERRLGVDRDMARRIKEAITLHRSAMEVESREASPAGWAWHQKEMGKCYLALAERGEDGALDQALSAFDASLSVYGEGDYGWAMSHSFRAVALTLKARRTGDPAPAREAVKRLDQAIAILNPVSDQAAAEARQRRTRAATLLDELNAR